MYPIELDFDQIDSKCTHLIEEECGNKYYPRVFLKFHGSLGLPRIPGFLGGCPMPCFLGVP